MKVYRKWTKQEDELFISLYPDHPNTYLCEVLHRSMSAISNRALTLGLRKTPEFAKQQREKNQFKKGNVPFNKGKKWEHFMSEEGMRNSAKTQFSGEPHNTRPPGYEMLRTADKKGRRYWWIKPADGRRMMPKHRWLWEQAYGSIPKGYNVQFKDGDTTNCVLDNLYLITRDKQMRENFDNMPAEDKAAMYQKIRDSRMKTYEREKVRLKWGFTPLTKLKVRVK